MAVKHRKSRAQRKTELVKIRVSEGQKKVLSDAATRDGQGLSPWLLALGMRAARTSEKAG
jgi:uncharacterized protein (DUF1778 family)